MNTTARPMSCTELTKAVWRMGLVFNISPTAFVSVLPDTAKSFR
jgi:hypothetical protein